MNWFKHNLAAFFIVNLFFVWFNLEAGATEATIPKRVVSLAPSVTETLFALGLGRRLVGVTNYCDYPPEALKLPKIGDFISPNIEVIMAKHPDLVIGVAGATDPQKATEMKRLGLKVVLVPVHNLSEILNSIKSIAVLLGNEEAGNKLVMKINAQVLDVRNRVEQAPRRPVLLMVGIRPLIAAGGKNFIDELITLAGGTNIAGDAAQPWLNLPDEYVVAKAPQVIIEAGMGSEREAPAKRWQDLESIPAVREGRIYSYRSDKILRPGPRLGEALAELARLIHPECFSPANDKHNGESRCESPRP
jgi:iron complex transport system substrate-binding protein